MTALDTLLARLDKVRQRAPDQWSARCPAHDDGGPSLSVKAVADGRVLIHCFAGCDVEQVVDAVGLQLQDLFPPKDAEANGVAPLARRRLLTAGQALELLGDEALIVGIVASDIGQGRALSDADRARVLLAASRIAVLRSEVMS